MSELLGSVSAAVSSSVVAALFPQIDTVDIDVLSQGTYAVRSARVPMYSLSGSAVQLCISGSARESAAELVLDRERGCLIAIASEWYGYLGGESSSLVVQPRASPADHFAAAVTLVRYAHAALPPPAWAWLAEVIGQQLGQATLPSAQPLPGAKPVSSLTSGSPRHIGGSQLLTAVRDAQANDLDLLMSWPWSWSDYLVGWGLYDFQRHRRITASLPGSCTDDLSSLVRLSSGESINGGVQVTYARRTDCLNLLVSLWDTYRDLGTNASFQAAVAGWEFASQVSGVPVSAFRRQVEGLLL